MTESLFPVRVANARRVFHSQKNEHYIYCHLITQELKNGRKIVYQNKYFIMLVLYAPRFPFEMWLLARLHSARFEEFETRLLDALASLFKESLLRMRPVLYTSLYRFVFHTAPVNGNFDYWHLVLMSKLTQMKRFEQEIG
jgi:UDPglucose--hexose-1-phosphate uridylyltransferase